MSKPRQSKELPASRRAFANRLVKWFEIVGRDYPWRQTHDPYEVLVSEVMLQQTQIATVLEKSYYTRFLERFPTVQALAIAEDDQLLKAWEGLGYYRRSRMLRETAKAVVDRHGGEFPSELDSLMELPGIGRYTAGALRAFAFRQPAVLVDGNVSRVISRLMDFDGPIDTGDGQKQIWRWAEELADHRRPWVYHSALMELGQRVCRPKHPICVECPVSACCSTRHPEELPRKKSRKKIMAVEEHAIWCRDAEGNVLMRRESGNRRTGLWKLPLRDPSELKNDAVVATQSYGITRYRVQLTVHGTPSMEAKDGDEWVRPERIKDLPMAAPFRKVVERLLDA